jgi:hypothetical protein
LQGGCFAILITNRKLILNYFKMKKYFFSGIAIVAVTTMVGLGMLMLVRMTLGSKSIFAFGILCLCDNLYINSVNI